MSGAEQDWKRHLAGPRELAFQIKRGFLAYSFLTPAERLLYHVWDALPGSALHHYKHKLQD